MNLRYIQRTKSRYVIFGFLISLTFTLFPVVARPASQGNGCQGSTVDILGPGVAKKYRAFLSDLKVAVGNGEKTKVASMISYPLLFIHGGRKTHVRDKAAFLNGYNTIFTAHVRQTIAQQSEKCLFGNDTGAMVGTGEVWFTELTNGSVKIITVNSTAGE